MTFKRYIVTKIRKADFIDVFDLAKIYERAHRHDQKPASAWHFFKLTLRGRIYLAYNQFETTAFVVYKEVNSQAASIESVTVLPEYGRSGASIVLLKHLQKKYKHLTVQVSSDDPVHRFYMSWGFNVIGKYEGLLTLEWHK